MEGGQHGIFIIYLRQDHAGELFRQGQVHHVRVCITNCTGILYITDILLQAGAVATGWVGHPCEMKWTLDG